LDRSSQTLALTPLVVGAVFGAGEVAKGDIIYGSVNFTNSPGGGSTTAYDFDISQPGFSDSFTAQLVNPAPAVYGSSKTGPAIVTPEQSGQVSISDQYKTVYFTSPLSAGDTIDASLTFSISTTYVYTLQSSPTAEQVVGFALPESTGPAVLYGWVDFSGIELSDTQEAIAISWGYDNTGNSITAESTPEPNPAALGAVGVLLAGVRGLRRRRQLKLAA
jgi:MYXO-CTERM domain-containing protein